MGLLGLAPFGEFSYLMGKEIQPLNIKTKNSSSSVSNRSWGVLFLQNLQYHHQQKYRGASEFMSNFEVYCI